jgi:two-component system cell cycle sensor histidine kinase/response regulator CckA
MSPVNVLSGSETILVVDDEKSVLSVTSAFLLRSGYKVLEANSGARALEICAGGETGIHLLLTDVVMPRMSGPELAERLLAIYPDLRVLYMSGYEDYHFEKYRPFALKWLLRKPFTPVSLLSLVRQALDEPRKREPSRQPASRGIRRAG